MPRPSLFSFAGKIGAYRQHAGTAMTLPDPPAPPSSADSRTRSIPITSLLP